MFRAYNYQLVKLIFCLFTILFQHTALCSSQPSDDASIFSLGELGFHPVDDQNKIPSGVITAITQDFSGFLWFGTRQGLVRYDGYRFRVFKHDDTDAQSIAGNYITTLWAGENGTVWAGTASDGISIYDPITDSFSHIRHDSKDSVSQANNAIWMLAGDEQDNLFVATNDGLHHVNTDSRTVTRVSAIAGCEAVLQKHRIRSVIVTRHHLWVGTVNGLCKVSLPHNIDKPDIDWSSALKGEEITAFSGQLVYALFASRNGKIWVGTRFDGAAFIDPENNTVVRINKRIAGEKLPDYKWVTIINQPKDDEIWIGTTTSGILVVNPETGALMRHISHDPSNNSSIGVNNINLIFIDYSGLIWVGTWGSGLYFNNPNNAAIRMLKHSPYRPDSLSHNNVYSLLELDNGEFWVGNKKTGIDIININRGVTKRIAGEQTNNIGLTGKEITVLKQTRDGSIWVGSNTTGLQHYDPENGIFTSLNKSVALPNNQLTSLLEVHDKLWIGTDAGLARLDIVSRQIESISDIQHIEKVEGHFIQAMVLRNGQEVWIATDLGLYVLSLSNNRLMEISAAARTANRLSDNYITSLMVDSKNRVLVGSAEGLDRLIEFDGKKAIFESLDDLVERKPRHVENLMEDSSGRIWDANGWLDPNNKDWQNFSVADEWNAGTIWPRAHIKTHDDTLLFGGTEGILMVKPEKWLPWKYEPLLVISELEINNEPQPIPDILTLAPQNNSFTIEFSALDYTAPELNQYSYKLEGFDRNWINSDASRRRITYTSLPPGDYFLRVKGTNRMGIWSRHQIGLPVVQIAAWYETPMFRVSSVALFLVSLVILFKVRTRSLKRQKTALNKVVKERTRELEEKNRQLEMASFTDPLTGAHNRYFFNTVFRHQVGQLKRAFDCGGEKDKRHTGLMLLDADYFKRVNDVYGHHAGDMVLKQLTKILQQNCRESDKVIRWGGEEFVVIYYGTSLEFLQNLAEKIRTSIASHPFYIDDAKTIEQTCSIGLCTLPFVEENFDAFSIEQSVQIADNALYMAKHLGRNRWVSLACNLKSVSDEQKRLILEDAEKAIELGYVAVRHS